MEYSNLKYTIDDIDKIVDYTSWSVKKKIDTLLHIDCIMYANLGIDSTKTERLETKKKSRLIYRAIKKLDENVGQSLLTSVDKP
tara:strand:- start:5380 stop:5631 length:252 start_codon:yes stop_codon:yes gene_type:complete